MEIGIIGSGNIGETLARQLAARGHQVSIANSRGPASLAELANEIGATAITPPQAALKPRAPGRRPFAETPHRQRTFTVTRTMSAEPTSAATVVIQPTLLDLVQPLHPRLASRDSKPT